MKISMFFLLLILCAALSPSLAVTGSFKPEISLTGNRDSTRFLLTAPLRLMYRTGSGVLSLKAAWTLTPSAGDPALNDSDLPRRGVFRIRTLASGILPDDTGDGSYSLVHELNRFSLEWRPRPFSVKAGRQAVFWGVARSVSPTDIVAPLPYGTIDTEYRSGVDAVRVRFQLGMLSQLETGCALGRDCSADSSAFWARGRFYILRTDVNLLAALRRGDTVAGFSLNRTLGGATAWVETAVVYPDDPDFSASSYWSMTAGFDRAFLDAALYAYLEYHHSSPGSKDPEGYAAVMSGYPYKSGGVSLLGKNYLSPGISWTPSPLWTVGSSALLNLGDGSGALSLSAEYSLGDNLLLLLGGSAGISFKGGADADNSEFFSWTDRVSFSLGYYF